MPTIDDTLMERSINSGWRRSVTATCSSSAPGLVVGIDFGTTFSGVAFANSSIALQNVCLDAKYQNQLDAVVEKITVIKTWPNGNQQYAEKTPTILSYTDDGKPVGWGGQVKHNHSIKISHFKLGLQEDTTKLYRDKNAPLFGGFLSDPNWKHPALPSKTALDYATDYLALIGDYVVNEVLTNRFGDEFLKNQQINFVVTVPAIWSDQAKSLTRQAAERAGIPTDKLTLVTEPEAAALYCMTTCQEVDLRPGDYFMVCDAGGGTVVCP